jgi:very-short-patch-repair endonuclease
MGGRGVARDRARSLRRNQTDTEAALWNLLRAKRLQGAKFRRQFPIGNYIADFACPVARLIIEADGGQHAENSYDQARDAWLLTQDWRVIRFWNTDILTNPEGVLTAVLAALATPLPPIPTAREWAPPAPGLRSAPGTPVPSAPTRGEATEGTLNG